MKKTAVIIAALAVAGVASAGTVATPHVAGGFQGWDPAATPMTETFVGSDIWTYDVTGLTANERQEFKITDGTWGTAVPAANSWLYADGAGNVTITYDGNTYSDGWSADGDRIGLSTDPGAWTAVGDSIGWDNANALAAMTPLGGGIYSFTQLDVADGTYNGKVTMTGTWDAIGADNRSIDAWNIEYTTLGSQNDVIWTVDAYAGTAKIEVVPEPATIGLIGMAGLGMFLVRRQLKI